MLIITKINKFILDILFPIKCISCGKENEWLCESCQARIKIRDEHVCGICERVITPDGRTCLACKKIANKKSQGGAIDGFIVASSYLQFPIASAVHLFKYRFIRDLHIPLGNLLVRVLQKTEIPLPDIIVSVPLHHRRLRWRGFNQASLLAKHLAMNLLTHNIIPFDEDLLIRNRHTSPQMRISDYKFRKLNIADAFSILPNSDIKNKTILLVDDIATTGSTIFECAKVLKAAGAKEVFAIVVARQETGA
ncbi:MAG: ComF family protein [Candidatus Moranbacteria bacterium]|nr:ComF family protein [Candidatus Moranbacteria bacterium]